jgi:hypothetical protein
MNMECEVVCYIGLLTVVRMQTYYTSQMMSYFIKGCHLPIKFFVNCSAGKGSLIGNKIFVLYCCVPEINSYKMHCTNTQQCYFLFIERRVPVHLP